VEVRDQQIRRLYEQGLGCRKVASELGFEPYFVFKRVRKMGILRSKEASRGKALQVSVPFTNPVSDRHLRKAGIGQAIWWFSQRGYSVSIPVEPEPYDLIVESDDGLKLANVELDRKILAELAFR